MSEKLIKEARKVLDGKSGPLDDEELEFLARDITKLGFKLGFARAYASGPQLVEKLVDELERKEKLLDQLRAMLKAH
ncbi:hypothetical protein [Sulfurivermis fontis]|uniref:hypothetical protein n=1 Tax=Sulfurivermis fontis TaxID=1972068 RepID=UPI000FD7E917|nr:hypothetical protein [Sulfurivermis fontis]